ncbi:MAG: hypothetical protein GY714_25840 [Desulfobacterales bacterium]|nr:hypothetical protein [Desulfobacterales bacterium]
MDEIKQGVPQGSILGPLFFNIFINDLFFIMKNSQICNYADDNSIWIKDKDTDQITIKLNQEMNLINKWFKDNSMILNGRKCKFMILEAKNNRPNKAIMTINNNPLEEVNEAKLLGVTLDSQLSFEKHIKIICKNAGKKLSALARLAPYLDQTKKILLMKTFILSYFNYCPLIWMFCSRKSNNLINSIHERALRIAYDNQSLTFTELLQKDNSTTIHQLNIHKLLIEIFKTIHNMNPDFMKELFLAHTSSHNLRSSHFVVSRPNTNRYGLDTLTHRGSSSWNLISNEIKASNSVRSFQQSLKNNYKEAKLCNCKLCTEFLPNIGYLNSQY